jgi:hypothetical protein
MQRSKVQDSGREFSRREAPQVLLDCGAKVGSCVLDRNNLAPEPDCSVLPRIRRLQLMRYATEQHLGSHSQLLWGGLAIGESLELALQPQPISLDEFPRLKGASASRDRNAG